MSLKLTTQGLLIYLTMAAYLLAVLVGAAGRRRRAGLVLYACGFVLASAAFGFRWVRTGHVPLQNLFEVFLTMGMLVFPLSLFCRVFLGVRDEWADAIVGLVVLVPAGFVFDALPRRLPPALQSFLFLPHVAAYLLAYVVMAKAAVQGMRTLLGGEARREGGGVGSEEAGYRLAGLGFPLLTAGLVLGAWWGKRAWGDWWNWDPKELWSLASWLLYLGYFHFRAMYGRRHPRIGGALLVAGLGVIVITLLWVNLARIFAGLHSYAV